MRRALTAGLLILGTASVGSPDAARVVAPAPPPATAAQVSQEMSTVHERLQNIARWIDLARGELAAAAARGEAPPVDLAAETSARIDTLDHLEATSLTLPGDEGTALRRKITAVRLLARNLLAFASGELQLPDDVPYSFEQPRANRRLAAVATAPANDACAMATPIGLETVTGSTAEATADGTSNCDTGSSPDVWFRFTAPHDGWFTLATVGSEFDTVLSVYTGCPTDPQARERACDDDTFGLQSGLSVEMTSGVTYVIRLGGFSGATGSYMLTVGEGGRISGTVTDAATSLPIEGTLLAVSSSQVMWVIATAITAADGTYNLPGLRGMSYVVATDDASDGYVDQIFDGVDCFGGLGVGCAPSDGTPLDLRLPDTTVTADFTLTRAAGLSGTAVDAMTGQPLTSYWIRLYDTAGTLQSSVTSTGGTWTMPEVPTGTYFALLAATEYLPELFPNIDCLGCDPTTGTPIVVSAGETTAGIAFTPSRLGSISGRVVDAATGQGFSGASVRVRPTTGDLISQSAQTLGGGDYTVGGLPPGSYTVTAVDYCHVDVLYPDVVCEGGPPSGCDAADGTPVVVDLSQPPVTGIDFTLAQRGRITGTVRSAVTGEPLPGVTVAAYDTSYNHSVRTRLTGADGSFDLACLAPDTYAVAVEDGVDYVEELYDDVECPGGLPEGCDRALATTVPIAFGETAAGIDFALQPGGVVEGRTMEHGSGAPLTGVRVEIWDAANLVESTSTDADGSYRVAGLDPGIFFVAADGDAKHIGVLYEDIPCPGGPPHGCAPSIGTPVSVSADVTTSGIDLAMQRKGAVAGRVTAADTGQGLESVLVQIWDGMGEPVAASFTSTDGTFSVEGLLGGAYFATAKPELEYLSQLYSALPCPLGPPAGCPVLTGTPIEVRMGETTEAVDFVVERGGRIEGTVTDPLSGEILEGAEVEVWNSERRVARGFTGYGPYAGPYAVSGLPPGTYFASTTAYVGQVYDGLDCLDPACDPRAGTPIEVTTGSTVSGVDFAPKRLGAVRGVVSREDTGEPIGGVPVSLLTPDGAWMGSQVSMATGEFRFDNRRPGTYTVATNSSEWLNELFREVSCPEGPDTCPMALAEPVVVDADRETRHVDFTLQHRPVISGRLTDAASGSPADWVTVALIDARGNILVQSSSDENGEFRVTALPGVAYLAADPLGTAGYLPELYDGVTCLLESVTSCLGAATPLTLEPDGDLTGMDLALERLGRITGSVVQTGTGMGLSARVDLYDAATAERVATVDNYFGSNGIFTFERIPWGSYYAVAHDQSGYFAAQLYAGIPCPGGPPAGCTLASGTPITVTSSAPLREGVDFHVDTLGTITGTIINAETGNGLWANTELLTLEGDVVEVSYSSSSYLLRPVPPGTYVSVAWLNGYTAQLSDGTDCASPDPASCNLAAATPFTVSLNETVSGIDFALHRATVPVEASVTSAYTGKPIEDALVHLYDSSGSLQSSCSTGADGRCSAQALPGTAFTTAWATHFLEELYDGLPCSSACDVTKGTPLAVPDDGSGTVSFVLAHDGPALVGRVTSHGIGVPYAIVDSWSADDGSWAESVLADDDGYFLIEVPAGAYHLSTDNGQGLVDEVYDGVLCPAGPAIDGFCDPAAGTAVTVVDAPVTGIDFDLLAPRDILFLDGFEDGLGGWSMTFGG